MDSHDKDVVAALIAALTGRLGAKRWALWFGTHVEFRLAGSCLTLVVGEPFILECVRKNFHGEVEAVCRELCGEVGIEYRLAEQAAGKSAARVADDRSTTRAAPPSEAHVARLRDVTPPRRLQTPRRFNCFGTFVAGPQNRLALSSARRAAAEPGRLSPLVIHGPQGVGKSHLLEAVWTQVRGADRDAHLVYVKAEQFTSHFQEAVRGAGMPAFRKKYRDARLLILDDLQFFTGKPATVQELVHTIDYVQQRGGQVIFAADRPPAEIAGLGPELASRLRAGVACPLEAPDLQTRRGILARFARETGLDLPADVAELIAGRIAGDGRALCGAVHRLAAFVEAYDEPLTAAMAADTLADLFEVAGRPVRLADIERAVCETFGLESKALQAASRAKDVTHLRMLAMFLGRELTRAAYSEIGSFFGQRSHSTAISAHHKIERWRRESQELAVRGAKLTVAEALRRVECRLRQA